MINARVELIDNKIKLSCIEKQNKTISWTCDVQGTFKLSQYSGILNLIKEENNLFYYEQEIDIISYPNLNLIGYAEFVFNGEHCGDKWKINVQGESEKYYFYVNPTNIKLNGKNTTKIITIDSSLNEWTYSSIQQNYFTITKNDNTLIITSLTDDFFSNIKITVSDNITEKNIYVSQDKIEECILEYVKTPDSGTTYQVSVSSYQANVFIPYSVDVSLLKNFKFFDNKQGLINVYVNDLTKNGEGKMIITNNCGKIIEIPFSYTPEIVNDEKFVIVNNDNEYTSVTINFSETDNVIWSGSHIEMPYNNINNLNIKSFGSNGNFCSWQPIEYDSDKILLQYDETTLSLSLIDKNPLATPNIITLQNDCGKQIIISYTVSDGLIIQDENIFLVGDANGNNKGQEYDINYENQAFYITLDSFLLSKDTKTPVEWNCISTDPVAQYNVTPSNGNGGENERIEIFCEPNIVDQLESDYVGVIKFQQLNGEYLECQVNVSHKGQSKEWYEVSRKLISVGIQPSLVELAPCQDVNYSEEIFCKATYEVTFELKTSESSNISYGTKTEYVEDNNGRFIINWTKTGSEDINIETIEHNDSQGNYYTYRCYAPSNLYNVGSYRTTIFNGSVDGVSNYDLTVQCNQDTSYLTDETVKGEGEIVGTHIGIDIKDENYDGKDDIIPRPGDTREYYGMSVDIRYSINRVDSCGFEIPNFDTSETETISEGVEFKSSPEGMFNLNTEKNLLEILENPWIYTFNSLNGTDFNISALDENTYKKTIHSSRDVEPRTGYVWAEYNGVISEKIEYQQEGGSEYVQYRLISKPDWCEVTLPSVFDFETEISFKFQENLVEEPRSGEIIIEQILPDDNVKKQITYTVTQAAAVFEFVFVQNNSTNYDLNIEWVESVVRFDVKSIVNGHFCEYSYNNNIPSWLTLNKNENEYIFNVSYNRDSENERSFELIFTQQYSNREIVFNLLQDAMKYIPMDGCKEAPVLISSGFIYRIENTTPSIMLFDRRSRNNNIKDTTLETFDVSQVGGRLKFYIIPNTGYTATVIGGTSQQAYSTVLNDDTVETRQRGCGSHWFSSICKDNALEIHEMHPGDQNNGTWYSDNFGCSLLSTHFTIFGYLEKE